MNNYIKIYDEVFTKAQCESMIEYHKNSESVIVEDDYTRFHQVGLPNAEIMNRLVGLGKEYMNNWPERFPDKYMIEMPRVKRYDEGDQFYWHVDVKDISTCARFVAFLVYLNDDFVDGRTVFADSLVQPKMGRVLVFPPVWTYYHLGEKVKDGEKYIMSSYLRYT
jgi:prolyl 4-hydroxylase